MSDTYCETKIENGLEIMVINVVPDDKGFVPNLLNQMVLAEFVRDDVPCEVWHGGRRYYSNVYKFAKPGTGL